MQWLIKYLPNLHSGKWAGTMCLTEAHCGTDLGLMRSKAELQENGIYKVTGSKIFISAGEHDLTENIIHLVLAKIPGGPEGSKGISLFIVPKIMINDDGSLGEKNGVMCGSIEEKMGIHGEETLYLKLRVPALNDYSVSFEADIIGVLGKVKMRDNFYAYKLKFVSKVYRRNLESRLQKTLNKNTPTKMAKFIFNEYLKGIVGDNVFSESPRPKDLRILDQSFDDYFHNLQTTCLNKNLIHHHLYHF